MDFGYRDITQFLDDCGHYGPLVRVVVGAPHDEAVQMTRQSPYLSQPLLVQLWVWLLCRHHLAHEDPKTVHVNLCCVSRSR